MDRVADSADRRPRWGRGASGPARLRRIDLLVNDAGALHWARLLDTPARCCLPPFWGEPGRHG